MPNNHHMLLTLLICGLACTSALGQVPGFGATSNDRPVLGFGEHADIVRKIGPAEWEFTIAYMQRVDRNNSGWLERGELRHFSDAQFKQADLDNDGRISIYEKALEGNSVRHRVERRKRLQREVQIIDGVEVTGTDRRSAQITMNRFDKNKNGILETDEIPERWTTTTLQDTDLNKDRRVSLRELQRRVALNRAVGQKRRHDQQQRDEMLARQRVEVWNLAAEMIRRHDQDKNNSLDRNEWPALGSDVGQADTNSNGFIDRTELSDWVAARLASRPGQRLPQGVPEWFLTKDKNHDGQLDMTEYISNVNAKEVAEFSAYDKNDDGIITAQESLAAARGKHRYLSDADLVIEPGFGVVSEIFIGEEYKVRDVDVQLSISHPGVEQLAATLIGPTGQRVELFTGEGKRWRGRNLEDTVFDDEAEVAIGAPNVRPPFRGSLQPDGKSIPEKASLIEFYGTSARGTWRLYVQATRGNQAGVLHGWALHIQPTDSSQSKRQQHPRNSNFK